MEFYPDNYLGLDAEYSDYASAKYAVLPLPYDATTSFLGGTRRGPRAIISASQEVEWFDDEYAREFHKVGIATLDPLGPNAAGPAAFLVHRSWATLVASDLSA